MLAVISFLRPCAEVLLSNDCPLKKTASLSSVKSENCSRCFVLCWKKQQPALIWQQKGNLPVENIYLPEAAWWFFILQRPAAGVEQPIFAPPPQRATLDPNREVHVGIVRKKIHIKLVLFFFNLFKINLKFALFLITCAFRNWCRWWKCSAHASGTLAPDWLRRVKARQQSR